ncbi:PsiF family protein [Ottowia testudinis]|uniref:PsiF family protein n=1 Tax=Ottowia testudinis TaxID=2816950 RepID=UPI003D651440
MAKPLKVTPRGVSYESRVGHGEQCLADGRKAQQEKMKTCNVEAKGKKGAERRTFMSDCLSKH